MRVRHSRKSFVAAGDFFADDTRFGMEPEPRGAFEEARRLVRKGLFAIGLAALAFAGGMLFNNKDALKRLRAWIGPQPPSVVDTLGKPADSKEQEPAASKPEHVDGSSETEEVAGKGIPAAPSTPLSLGGEPNSAKAKETKPRARERAASALPKPRARSTPRR